MVRRILLPCLASLVLYGVLFGVVLDRPLSIGMFRDLINEKLARGASIQGPKLVIIAGSNGPYSHSCETIQGILGLPCVNAGVAVGIGLDYLFARWEPLLRPGDTVYLPLEEAQYIRTRAANALGPDAAIMLRHDRATLLRLPPDRWLGAAFCFDARAALMSVIEMTLTEFGFADPRAAYEGTVNAWGDHIGATRALGVANAARLARIMPYHDSPAGVAKGYGTKIVQRFIQWAVSHGVRVVGGLPAGFGDSPIPDPTRSAIRAVFVDAGARFIDLGPRDDFPRSAFFDTPDHLDQSAQIAHSRLVAAALAPILAPERAASR
jgi:hypothetical protein